MGQVEVKRGRGRPALPPGEKRTVHAETWVKPAAWTTFVKVAEQRGLAPSAAVREAMGEWVRRHGGGS